MNFEDHATLAAKRASEALRRLSQILPNIRGPRQSVRKILACVVISRLLYGAPFWQPTIIGRAQDKMASILRKTMLRVTCCYRTTSYEAAAVISGIPPLSLLAEERRQVYKGYNKNEARDQVMRKWQIEWDEGTKGRWTHRIISNIEPWFGRKHGEVTFHLSQALTGH